MLRISILVIIFGFTSQLANAQHFASGIKIGEVDQTSAMVWARLTQQPKAKFELLKPKLKIPMPTEIVPGMAGEVQINYWEHLEPDGAIQDLDPIKSDWMKMEAGKDFTHQFSLKRLKPGKTYRFEIFGRKTGAEDLSDTIVGEFQTAPLETEAASIRFIVTTCQACRSVDSGPDGHAAYAKMLDFEPHFFVHTGDVLYYDKKPLAKTVAQARAKWNLMFSFGHNKRFHQQVASYFMKDDHDTLKNDCWPGQKYGEITFEQGLSIFREQVPMGEKTYRTVRWGKDVQIWMTENRDFRSANTMEDGPEKTILGAEQKKWLMDGIASSDATYKFLISPGPIVGPDKPGKRDNHANDAFAHEGQQLRDFLAKQERTYVICGDRHWQYCSKDPKIGVLELGCGPINDQHNFGGDPGEQPEFHRYFSSKGGFLGITVEDGEAKAEWFGVNDANGDVLPKAKVLHVETLGQ